MLREGVGGNGVCGAFIYSIFRWGDGGVECDLLVCLWGREGSGCNFFGVLDGGGVLVLDKCCGEIEETRYDLRVARFRSGVYVEHVYHYVRMDMILESI